MSALDEIIAERDAMHVRARRGSARDDEYTPTRWRQSILGVLAEGYEPRRVWVKVAAVALRAIEAIDRKNRPLDVGPAREPRPASYYDGPSIVALGNCNNCERPLTEHTGGNLACPESLR